MVNAVGIRRQKNVSDSFGRPSNRSKHFLEKTLERLFRYFPNQSKKLLV